MLATWVIKDKIWLFRCWSRTLQTFWDSELLSIIIVHYLNVFVGVNSELINLTLQKAAGESFL